MLYHSVPIDHILQKVTLSTLYSFVDKLRTTVHNCEHFIASFGLIIQKGQIQNISLESIQ